MVLASRSSHDVDKELNRMYRGRNLVKPRRALDGTDLLSEDEVSTELIVIERVNGGVYSA